MALTTASLFLDTSVLIAGLIELGSPRQGAQRIMDAIARGRLRRVLTAWHCCLEFYAVATRLPEDLRLTPPDALRLLEEEVLARLQIAAFPEERGLAFLQTAAHDRVIGGRIYDAHIAEIARLAGARTVVTDNRRHFASLLRHSVRVLTAEEFAEELRI